MLTMELRGDGTRRAAPAGCKRIPQRNHYTTVKMAPCKICGGKSSGFHFGVITCEACKAFFRRAMINKSTYECSRGFNCSERNGNLIGCSACRLQRCLTAGMSKRGVRKGRYSIALRTQAILDAIATEQEMACGVTNSSPPTPVMPQSPTRSLTPPESSPSSPWSSSSSASSQSLPPLSPASTTSESSLSPRIGTPHVTHAHSKHSILLECLTMPGVPICNPAYRGAWPKNGRLSNTPHTQGFTEEQARSFDDLIATVVELQQSVYPNYNASDDMQYTLQDDDLKRERAYAYLFGRSHPQIHGASKHVLTGTNMELDKRLSDFRKIAIETERDIALYIEHIQRIPGFNQLFRCDVIKLLKSAYSEFWLFSNFASMAGSSSISRGTDDVMNAHKKVIGTLTPKDHVDAVRRFADELKKLELTREEISIIRMLLLTFTDRCALKEPQKVQDIHDTFTNCLLHHLNKSTSTPFRRLTRIVDKLVAARSITYMNQAVNEQFLKNWGFIVHEYPLWREMMVFDDGQTTDRCSS